MSGDSPGVIVRLLHNSAYYKSAELHTHKARIPKRVYFLFAVPFILAGLAWVGVGYWQRASNPGARIASSSAGLGPAATALPAAPGPGPAQRGGVSSLADYVQQQTPRVPGLAHTAPLYDEVTRPTDAPWPVGCVATKKACRCVDQQGTDYVTSENVCRAIVAHGLFKSWGQGPQQPVRAPEVTRRTEPDEPRGGGVIAWSGPMGGTTGLSAPPPAVSQPGQPNQPANQPVVPASSPWAYKG